MKANCKFNLIAMIAGIAFSFTTVTVVAQDAEENLTIEEVTVTAQKRSQSLQEVPIAISVISAEAIDQSSAQELRDLGEQLPNVSFGQNSEFRARVVIRGVGLNARNIGLDSRVGVYLDGVYLGQGPALNQDLVDLDHIEVLRGPQGTLFGKNTVAGAVSMISKKPNQEFAANATVNAMNLNGLELKGDVNIPLGKNWATRIYVSHRERDGFVDNIWDSSQVPTNVNLVVPGVGPVFGIPLCDSIGGTTPPGCQLWAVGPDQAPAKKKLNDIDTQSFRAQLRFQPGENLDINLSVDGLKSDSGGLIGTPLTDTFGSTIDRFAPEVYEISFSEDVTDKRDIFGANLNVDYALDNGFDFRSITAYRDTKEVYHNDTDASALDFLAIDYTDAYEQTTQEFQLISPDEGSLKYVVGLYYYRQDSTTARDAVTGNAGWLFGMLPGDGAFSRGKLETESWAVFLNGSYDFSDAWQLGFGFRYTDETKDTLWHLDGTRSGAFNIGSTSPGGYVDSRVDTHFSPMLSLSYLMNDDTHIYARYSTGYKSGGFNLDYITQRDLDDGITFDKETVVSYELGLKGTYLDDRLSLNAAVFLAQYDDYQFMQFFDLGLDPVTGTQVTSLRITNAAKVDTSGLEVEATFNITENLTLNASLGLLDATFDDFPGGLSRPSEDPNAPPGTKVSVNAAGNHLIEAPEVTASFGIQHYTRLGSFADLLVRLDVLYTGDYFTTIENERTRALTGTHPATFMFDIGSFDVPNEIDYGHVNAFTTLNGRIGLIDTDGAWDIYLWGRNLTDEGEYIDYWSGFFGGLSAVPMVPRTYGIEASYHF